MVKTTEHLRLGIALDLHCRYSNPVSRKDNYFEESIRKFDFILSNCDVLIQAGDVFTKSREEDLCKTRLLSVINKHKKRVYIVIGNHDVENDVLDTIIKTSLGTLAMHPLVTILTPNKIWNICGLKVGVLKYHIEDAKTQTFDEDVDIVIGHHFYNWTRNLDLSLTDTDILRYNAPLVFLGHDHEPHEVASVGNSLVYRFGSVMREDLTSYTPNHHPCFAIIDVPQNEKILNMPTLVEIPHNSFEDAFRWEEKKSFKKCRKLVSDIKEFLSSMDIESKLKKTIGTILAEDLKAPKDVIDYLQLVYRVNHQEF